MINFDIFYLQFKQLLSNELENVNENKLIYVDKLTSVVGESSRKNIAT